MHENIINCPLFNGLHKVVIEKLLSDIFFKEKTFEKDDIIAYQNDKVESLIIIVEGSVRGEMIDFSGKSIVIEEIEAPRPIAPAFIFGKENTFPVNVIAQTEGKIAIFPKDSLLKLMQRNDRFLTNFLNSISNRAQFLSYKIRFLSFHSIKGKFAFYILDLAKNNQENTIRIPVSQNKLAELFGVTRPSLGRAIREMHNDGIIFAKGKNIEILNTYDLYDLMK